MLRLWGVGLALLCAVAPPLRAEPAARGAVRGRVVDGRGAPVRGATVTLESSRASARTDGDGRYEIDDAAVGDTLVVTKDGYAAALATAAAGSEDVVLLAEDQGVARAGEEVITVHGEPPPAAPGAMRASRGELQSMPGTAGDLLQTLSTMPGVTATAIPLGASGVVIRGSSPQDSKILVDGFEVPVLYHDLGFRSVVREPAIDTLDYVPGGFDVATGRATSGIVSVTTRAGGEGPGVEVETSTGELGVLAQGRAGELRYMVAVRRSVIDLLLPLLLPDDLDLSFTTVPRYYDEQLRLDYRLSPHWELRLSSLGSDDALALYTDRAQSVDHRYTERKRFVRGIAAARYVDGPWRARLELSGIAQHYDRELGAVQHLHATAPAVTGRAEIEHSPGDVLGLRAVSWRLGGEAVHTRYGLDVALPREPVEGEPMSAYDPDDTSLRAHGRVITDDVAAWTQVGAGIGARVRATAGVRLDGFRRTGDVAIQPRGELSVRLSPTLVARASAGLYTRPPEFQSELLSQQLHPERATQLIAGVEYEPSDGVRIQASIYDTERSQLVTRTATGELGNAGRGTSYGAELAATLRRGPWFAWLAYSYARATRVDAPGAVPRRFDFEQPHHLEALASYRRGAWTFGARFRLLSGLPYTPVVATVFDSDRNLYLPIYGPINSARTDLHHQIDLRIEKRSTLGPFQITRYLDLHNVYLNQSPVTYFYSYDYSERVALSWLPILPVGGVRATW